MKRSGTTDGRHSRTSSKVSEHIVTLAPEDLNPVQFNSMTGAALSGLMRLTLTCRNV